MKRTSMADNIHGNFSITEFEKKILSHVLFNRLHDVYQNSTVYLTFPTNRTKRFEHSVGTMHLSSEMFNNAIYNSSENVLQIVFQKYELILKDRIKKIKENNIEIKYVSKYIDKLSERVTLIDSLNIPEKNDYDILLYALPQNLKHYKNIYAILLQAVRVTALLHDVGHPPYSHVTEFALNRTCEKYQFNNENTRVEEFNQIMDVFFDRNIETLEESAKNNNGKKLHECMGDKIIENILFDNLKKLTEKEKNNKALVNDLVYEILICEMVFSIINSNTKKPLNEDDNFCFSILHGLIDGSLDSDRLDYSTRDSINSGLNKGKIEYERLYQNIFITLDVDKFRFALNTKALNTVEDFLTRRWEVYSNIIFHHRVIKTDYLLQEIIYKLSCKYLDESIDVNISEEEKNDLLPLNISGLWKALKNKTATESKYFINQWDDSWLITVLKKYYFEEYLTDSDDIILTKQLEEFLTNKKNYFSVIKRLEDFLVIDNQLTKYIASREGDILNNINILRELSSKQQATIDRIQKNEKEAPSAHRILLEIEALQNSSKSKIETNFQFLSFSKIIKIIKIMSKETDIEIALENIVKKSAEKIFTHNEIEDLLVIYKKYDIGLNNMISFVTNSNKNEVLSIHKISSISQILNTKFDAFPQLYIYIMKSERNKDSFIDLFAFLEDIGYNIGKYYVNFINEWINDQISQFTDLNKC